MRNVKEKDRNPPLNPTDKLSLLARSLLVLFVVLVGLWLVGSFVAVGVSNFRYPVPGCTEGSFMNVFVRLSEGRPIYGAATREFIPTIYFPGYYVIGWLWSLVWGLSIRSILLFNVAVAVGILCVMFWIVRRSGGSWMVAVSSCVVWMGFMSFWNPHPYPLAPDSLLTLFVLSGMACMAAGSSLRWLLGSAACFTAAALTKQNAAPLIFLPAFVAAVFTRSLGKFLYALIPAFVGIGLAFLANATMGGQMFDWTLGSLAKHSFLQKEWASKFRIIVAAGTPCLALMGIRLLTWKRLDWRRSEVSGPLLGLLFLFLMGYAGYLKLGGGTNHPMPFFTTLIPLAVVWGRQALKELSASRGTGIWLLLVAIQMTKSLYDPREFMVPAQVYEYQSRVLQFIKSIDGPVLYPAEPWLVLQAGKPMVFGGNELDGLIMGRYTKALDEGGLPPDVRRAIEERYYTKIVYLFPTLNNSPLLAAVRENYVREAVWQGDPSFRWPIAWPREVYRRPNPGEDISAKQ